VSADTQQRNDAFRASLALPYPLVGDPDGTIRSAYRVKWPVIGLARRTTYVVGADRRIRRAIRSERDIDAHIGGACSAAESV
jgi:peroxiredoxin